MENKEQIKEHIKTIIDCTFKIIKNVYDYQQEISERTKGDFGSHIIFPKKRQEEAIETKQDITRVSEQELKQIFIEQLNKEIEKGWDVYYSVETPTKDIYRFSDVEKPLCGKEIEEINKDRERNGMPLLKGQSANFDLVIHDGNFKRIVLIEFKANNVDKKDYAKDFKKLNNQEEGDDSVLRYFIEIVRNTNSGTFPSLHGKIEGNENIFRCCSLSNGDITKEVISAPIKK